MTGDEPQGTMGRVQTAVVSFPPSFARTFSSKERCLGTRQRLNGFRSSYQIPYVRYEVGNFITQLSIESGNLNQSCKFRAKLRWEVEREVHAIRLNSRFFGNSVGFLWHSHGKNLVRLYPTLQSQPIGLPKIFIDYLFSQADQSDFTKSVSIFNRFGSSEGR